MSHEHLPLRPLSVAIPKVDSLQGPYCPRRPTLKDILANTSPSPWTLTAFMAYLSNNHCLETLEFTMDAGRYRKHYAKMLSRASNGGAPPTKDREYVQALWRRLVEAYIEPNGSREVNLPSDVRDPILHLPSDDMPPAPEKLDMAVMKIYELMEDSVLVPFLNSVYPHSPHPNVASCPFNTSEEHVGRSYDDRSHTSGRSRQGRNSPPPQSAVEPHAHSYSHPIMMNRQSAPSGLSTSLNRARFSVKLAPSTSSPAVPTSHSHSHTHDSHTVHSDIHLTTSTSGGSGPSVTDDGGSPSSPIGDSLMTPPMSPPSSEAHSPKRDSGMWRKLGRLSGMKVAKKKSQGMRVEEEHSP